MATSIADLRKKRASTLTKIVDDLNKKNSYKEDDKRFWKLSRDATGNGSAVIRFLPPIGDFDLPWVKIYKYGFKGANGKWYINDSPSTIGAPDPVMEFNGECYASDDQDRKEDAKKRKRQTKFISNILVVRDPANPDNEGKVFLFEYGPKIHDMIAAKAKPEFDDEQPISVWDLDEGCNFKLRIKTVKDYPNYDSSEWAGCTELFGGDEKQLQKIIDQCYDLGEFIDPKRFKSYEQLKTEFEKVMTTGAIVPAADRIRQDNQTAEKFDPVAPKSVTKVETSTQSDDSDLDYLKSLLDD